MAVSSPLLSLPFMEADGEDLLADLPVKAYGQKMAESPHMQKVLADRKENAALMASLTAKKT